MWVPRLGRSRISGDQLAGPDAGGVDDGAGADGAGLAGAGVGERGAVAESASLDLDPRVHPGPVGGGGAGDREDEAYVVLELAVPGQDRAAQPLASYDGGEGERLGDTDPTWPGKRLAAGPRGQPQQVAGADAAAGQRGLGPPDARGERHQHRQRPDQVGRGGLHQDAALDGALVGDVELALGQVAQPAVHQLGAPAAGAEGDVLGVDGDHVEAAGGGVERDAGAGDAQADDEDVGRTRGCRRDRRGSSRRSSAAGTVRTRWPSSRRRR